MNIKPLPTDQPEARQPRQGRGAKRPCVCLMQSDGREGVERQIKQLIKYGEHNG